MVMGVRVQTPARRSSQYLCPELVFQARINFDIPKEAFVPPTTLTLNCVLTPQTPGSGKTDLLFFPMTGVITGLTVVVVETGTGFGFGV